MKVSVIGTGYVGLTLACLSNFGHDVVLIGRSKNKIDLINSGISPIYEPGLDKVLKENIEKKKLKATLDYSEMDNSDVIFICVGTPSRENGSVDLSQIITVTKEVSLHLKGKYKVVVVKSTVPPGTTKETVIPMLEESSGLRAGEDFGVCMNPEFLREGTGIYDFQNPDKIVIGCLDKKSSSLLLGLYKDFDEKITRVVADLSTAEMIKYVQNSALATKISFINEIANICEKLGIDVYDVAYAIGLDSRIGPKFLQAGAGWGGSCFPKDVKGLLALSKAANSEMKILQAVFDVNKNQPYRMIELAENILGDLKNKKIAILGLSFKPDTDDMRDASSIPIINKLLEAGSEIKAYDPKALENAKEIYADKIIYCNSLEECLVDADLCLIVTEWEEFKNLDLSLVKCPIIDGRRALDPEKVRKAGIVYKGIGYKENFK